MPSYYFDETSLTRFYGEFVYDEGMPVSGTITRVIGYSEIEGTTTPTWRATNLNVEIGDHLNELNNNPSIWVAQYDGVSHSFYHDTQSYFSLDVGSALDARFRLDNRYDGREFEIEGGTGAIIRSGSTASISVENSIDTHVIMQDVESYVTAYESDGIRFTGSDMSDVVWVYQSTGIHISLGTGNASTAASNEVYMYGCDEFRIIGAQNRDSVEADADNGRVLGHGGDDYVVLAGDNNVVFGGLGDDYITIDGDGYRVVGGEGNDIIKVESGTGNLFGGDGADYFEFVVDGEGFASRIKDFDTSQDVIALYLESGEKIGRSAAFDLFQENAVERNGHVFSTVYENEIVLHNTALEDLTIDNF